jgi:hypothetical protein
LKDLVVLGTSYREGGGYLSLIHNLGNDEFAVADFDEKVGSKPVGMVLEDLDHDGLLDAVIADLNDDGGPGRVFVFQGVAPGYMSWIRTAQVGEYPEGIAGGDFDGDGRADVAIASSGFGKVEVWKNESLPALGGRAIATVLSQAAAVESVEVVWQAPGVTRVTVERSLVGKQWQPLAQAHMDREGHLRYVDRTVSAGGRYRYRLASRDPGVAIDGGEAWFVITPGGLAPSAKVMVSQARAGEGAVMLSVPQGSDLMLELFDVSGRRVLKRQLGWMEAGRHRVDTPEVRDLPPGLYWARVGGTEGAAGKILVLR